MVREARERLCEPVRGQAVQLWSIVRSAQPELAPKLRTDIINSPSLGSHRNPTYLLTDSKAQRYVLRKKPAGELLSKTAHAVEREFAVLKALGEKASGVPVPRLYALYALT